jgi:hypothetical protein
MSQRDMAPSRAGPKESTPREEGDDRKVGRARRRDVGRACDHNSNVEMILEQGCCLDGALVAAVHEEDALAPEVDKGDIRHWFRRSGNERGHLRAGAGGLTRPTGGLTQIYEAQITGSPRRDLAE